MLIIESVLSVKSVVKNLFFLQLIIEVQGGDGTLRNGDFAIVEADGLLGLLTGNADTRGNCTNMRPGVLYVL